MNPRLTLLTQSSGQCWSRKNVHLRGLSAIARVRERKTRGLRSNERSIARSLDLWKREYALVRFLLIERQLLAAAHVTRLVRFLAKCRIAKGGREVHSQIGVQPNIVDFNPAVSLSRHRYLFRSNDQIPNR